MKEQKYSIFIIQLISMGIANGSFWYLFYSIVFPVNGSDRIRGIIYLILAVVCIVSFCFFLSYWRKYKKIVEENDTGDLLRDDAVIDGFFNPQKMIFIPAQNDILGLNQKRNPPARLFVEKEILKTQSECMNIVLPEGDVTINNSKDNIKIVKYLESVMFVVTLAVASVIELISLNMWIKAAVAVILFMIPILVYLGHYRAKEKNGEIIITLKTAPKC